MSGPNHFRQHPLLRPKAPERPLVGLDVRGHDHVHRLPQHPGDGVGRGGQLVPNLVKQPHDRTLRSTAILLRVLLAGRDKKVIDYIVRNERRLATLVRRLRLLLLEVL